MNRLSYIVLATLCCACSGDAGTEKYQGKRNHIINVHDKVKAIPTDSVMLSVAIVPCVVDDYIIIGDYRSPDECIHLFDKNTFAYVAGTAYTGQGPGEITRLGHIANDDARRTFFVTDLGRQQIFAYPLDSVLADPRGYIPEVKVKLNEKKFPNSYHFIHDTLCIGVIIEPAGASGYKAMTGKWNMTTDEIRLMPYEHPEVEKKRIGLAVSPEHGIYVECHLYRDLMTICTLDGELKYNVYGPDWTDKNRDPKNYYSAVVACCGNQIIALYSGKNTLVADKAGGQAYDYPSQLLVFDLEGNYLQTLETGYPINSFCYDKANNRLILTLNDEPQVACLDLDGAGA
jgi:hypothetical protein